MMSTRKGFRTVISARGKTASDFIAAVWRVILIFLMSSIRMQENGSVINTAS